MASVINQIKLGDTEYAIAASAYAECSTAAGTATKVATICTDSDTTNTAFTLVKGVSIQVKFSNTNSASNPKLNVNSTGAKSIYYKGASITASYLKANYIYTFVYNGTQWELVGEISTDADTKNTAGSTDTDSKIFLVGATNQAANSQTYSHSEVYVDTDHFLTDTAGFRTGSDSHMDCTEYKNRVVKITDGSNVTLSTFNFPTTANGSFTIATQEWVEQNYNGADLENYVDLSTNQVITGVKQFSGNADMFGAAGKTAVGSSIKILPTSTDTNHSIANLRYDELQFQDASGLYTTSYTSGAINYAYQANQYQLTLPQETGTLATQEWVGSGYAAKSHGTHVSYSSTAPKANGTASVGTASTVSRSDHVHPTDTSRASSTHTHGNIASSGTLGTASRVVVTDTNKKVTTSSVTTTELGYLKGVTDDIQDQLNIRAVVNQDRYIDNCDGILNTEQGGAPLYLGSNNGWVKLDSCTTDGTSMSSIHLDDNNINIKTTNKGLVKVNDSKVMTLAMLNYSPATGVLTIDTTV